MCLPDVLTMLRGGCSKGNPEGRMPSRMIWWFQGWLESWESGACVALYMDWVKLWEKLEREDGSVCS